MKTLLCALSSLCVMLSGCLDVQGAPIELAPGASDSSPRLFTLARAIRVEPSPGRGRTLSKGSVWSMAGSLAQGEVYKPRDTVFTLQRINEREAYLVLSGSKVVGYYLPADHSYIAEQQPYDIPIQ